MSQSLNLVCSTFSETPSPGRMSEAYSRNAVDGPMKSVVSGVGLSASSMPLKGDSR